MFDFPELRILHPEMVPVLLAVPVVSLFCWVHIRSKRNFRLREGLINSIHSISAYSTARGDRFFMSFAVLASLLLGLALMRPQLNVEETVPEYEKQDLILILDRSASMHARDVPPSRFTRAIREIKAFLVDKPDVIDRVGLIGFAGTSVMLSHLTSDLETLFFFLDWIIEDKDVHYGTNVSGAIGSALEMAEKDDSGTHKTFLLVSDGDDESTELTDLLNQLNDAGIRVHTIGIGTEQPVPIPVPGVDGITEYLMDEEGNQLTTRFNESTMRMVASMTQGSFFRSSTGHELAASLSEVIRHEQEQIGWKRTEGYRDLYGPLLLIASVATFFIFLKA